MSDRRVEVEAKVTLVVDGDRPIDARADAAAQVKEALEAVEGKEPGIAVGTSGGEEVR